MFSTYVEVNILVNLSLKRENRGNLINNRDNIGFLGTAMTGKDDDIDLIPRMKCPQIATDFNF